MTSVSDLSYRDLQSELKELGESARGKRDELEERLIAARLNGGAATTSTAARTTTATATSPKSAPSPKATGMVSSLLASAARTPLPGVVGAAVRRRVSSSSGGGGEAGARKKTKAKQQSDKAFSLARAAVVAALALSAFLFLALVGSDSSSFGAQKHPAVARLSEAFLSVPLLSSLAASTSATTARARFASALESLRDRWSERAERAAASRSRESTTVAAGEVEATEAERAAAASKATATTETPPPPAAAPPSPSPSSNKRPCSRSLSPTLVNYLLPPGPAWDGARAAVAAAFQGTRVTTSTSAETVVEEEIHFRTKATAVLLAAWSDGAREAAIGVIEAALPQECLRTHPSPRACYLRFPPSADVTRRRQGPDSSSSSQPPTAGDLQALLTSFLKDCPDGIVTVPSAHELSPAAATVLINALSEGGGFEAPDGTGHVPAGGALFVGTSAAPASLRPTTDDEVALVLGAKRALADGLASRGTEAVAADALRRRWDVVAPVIEDEGDEEEDK